MASRSSGPPYILMYFKGDASEDDSRGSQGWAYTKGRCDSTSGLRLGLSYHRNSPWASSAVPAFHPEADLGRRHHASDFIHSSLIERQYGSCDLPSFHCTEGFVDIAEAAALGDHRVEVEPALAVEIEIGRDVVAEAVRAHARGLHLAFRADCHPRKLDHCVRRQHADDRRCTPDRERLDCLAAQLRIADSLEGVVHAQTAGQFTHRLYRVGFAGIDKMRGADAHRDLALLPKLVDCDDPARTADPRALDDRQPDAPAAIDGHRLASF